MITEVVSKPVYQILNALTGESRIEVALPLALKELIRLKLQEAHQHRILFEERYSMDFAAFKKTWDQDENAEKHRYEAEQDIWEWEAAVTDQERYQELAQTALS